MRSTSIIFMLASLTLATASALAHEFWIEPATFHPAPDALVNVGLRVGDGFPGEPVTRKASRIEKFIVLGPDGEKPVVGEDGGEPAGVARLGKPGLYVIGYRSKPSPITLEGEKFEAYLAEEGLNDIIDIRKQRGESQAPGREIFSRCAKSLVRVGSEDPAMADRPLGFRLELLAEGPVVAAAPADEFAVRLMFERKPCPGRLVIARHSSHPEAEVRARTDENGRVRLRLAEPGAWLIAAVHMIPVPPAAKSSSSSAEGEAQWESLWASLTLEIPAAREKPAKSATRPAPPQ